MNWRYYYDVPEFTTVLADPESEFHLGYFRDDPAEMPAFVASSDPSDGGCRLTAAGENLFGAVYNRITGLIQDADPFRQTALQKLKEAIHVFATMKVRDRMHDTPHPSQPNQYW